MAARIVAEDVRISEVISRAEGEGVTLDAESLRDCESFLVAIPASKELHMFYHDNGNMGLFAKDARGNKLEMEFVGGQQTSFIMTVISERGERDYVTGTVQLETVASQLDAYGLSHLIV